MLDEYAVLAVDGGGTRCRAVFCDRLGTVYGYGVGGPANYHSVGIDGAIRSLTALLTGLPGRPFSVSCAVFGLAGLDSERDKQLLTDVVRQALATAGIQAASLLLENDGMMTLTGAAGGGTGLLLIAGTGSIACGITQAGRRTRVGGWGYRVGDEGSGYSIGLQALTHIMRAYDGREPQSGINEAVLQVNGYDNVEELFAWIYSPAFSPNAVAALAPVVCRLAEAGDWKAMLIAEQAVEELRLMAASVITQLNLQTADVHAILSGGILQKNSLLRGKLENAILRLAPLAKFAPARYEPIAGGVLLGLNQLGIADERIVISVADAIKEKPV